MSIHAEFISLILFFLPVPNMKEIGWLTLSFVGPEARVKTKAYLPYD